MKRVVDFESFWVQAAPELILIVIIMAVWLTSYLKF